MAIERSKKRWESKYIFWSGDWANTPPIANAGPDQSADTNVELTFDGSGSSDPDGTIITWAWDFGDTNTGSGEIVTHSYTAGGTYTVTLTVTDNNGATGTDTCIVKISYTISGNVKDYLGSNLVGAAVAFVGTQNYNTTTDLNGNYSQEVAHDTYTVTVSYAGHLDTSHVVDATASNKVQNFVLDKPIISGNVKNSKHQNLPDATITFMNTDNYQTNADADGNYSQKVTTGIYTVTASIIGNIDQSATVDATTSNKTQDFVFPITTAPHDKGIRLKERYLLE